MDQTIRTQFAVLLVKQETTSGVDASPSAATDAIAFEADSFTFNSPFTSVDSNEITGSLVVGAPQIKSQAATISFKTRIRGAGTAYSASVKPPAHVALAACGKKPVFTGAVTAAAATAGTTTSITAGTGFSSVAQAYRGQPFVLSGDANAGDVPFCVDYSATKVATLTDTLGTAASTSTSVAIPANWTYQGVSNSADQPSVTIYFYEDNTLRKFVGCRGSVDVELTANGPGFFTFNFTGVYVSLSTTAVPNAVVASNTPPVMLQGTAVSEAVVVNRKPLAISSMKLTESASVETPDDPNSVSGFGNAILGARTPTISIDPYATVKETRDTLSEIQNGSQYPAVFRVGSVANNRYAIVVPTAQPQSSTPGSKNSLRGENIELRALAVNAADSNARDSDWSICFY